MNFIDKKIEDYCVSKSNRPSSYFAKVTQYTQKNTQLPQMMVGDMEASFLGFIVRMIKAKIVLEVGTFTGYSSLSMAEQMPPGSKVISLDINQDTSAKAAEFAKELGVDDRVEYRVGPALEEIEKIDLKLDFVFIDADKQNYLNYLKACLPKLNEGGIIALDNTLWGGRVLQENPTETSTRGIQQVNDFVADNPKLYGTLLPIRDGIFLIQKI